MFFFPVNIKETYIYFRKINVSLIIISSPFAVDLGQNIYCVHKYDFCSWKLMGSELRCFVSLSSDWLAEWTNLAWHASFSLWKVVEVSKNTRTGRRMSATQHEAVCRGKGLNQSRVQSLNVSICFPGGHQHQTGGRAGRGVCVCVCVVERVCIGENEWKREEIRLRMKKRFGQCWR